MGENDFLARLLGLDGFEVESTNMDSDTNTLFIVGRMQVKPHICPKCGNKTQKIHDYRHQVVEMGEFNGNLVVIEIFKRRYVCPECNKRFFEEIPWLERYQRHVNKPGEDEGAGEKENKNNE